MKRTKKKEKKTLRVPRQYGVTDEYIMPRGKHKGVKLGNVPADYLIWMNDMGYLNGQLTLYVRDNMEALQLEISKSGATN